MSMTKKTALAFAGAYLLCVVVVFLAGQLSGTGYPPRWMFPLAWISYLPFVPVFQAICMIVSSCAVSPMALALLGGVFNMGLYAALGAGVGAATPKLRRVFGTKSTVVEL